MSYSVTPGRPRLTPAGVQLPCHVEFSGTVERIDSVVCGIADARVLLSVSSHPVHAVHPNEAAVTLPAEAVRHLIARLDALASALEAGVK